VAVWGEALDNPLLWTILVEREMRPTLVMILKIGRQHTAQVTLIEDDDVIETFAADRADDALHIGVLPWGRGAVTTSSIPIAWTRSRKV
jgi:hypothetical protein